MLKRAWSTIEFKAIDEDKRIIEGIASTPATDRYEDVVEPEGAQYKLPLPFLWQHQHGNPIGWVEDVKTSAAGIRVKVRIAAAGVTEEIDKAWALIKAGLVRGLSIGFSPIESAHINGTYGYHFTKWDWLELSAVTVPANADASITSIKSLDEEHLRAVSGNRAVRSLTRKTPTGDPGRSIRQKDTIMKKTFAVQLAEAEATLASSRSRMEELMKAAGEEGRTLSGEEAAEYEELEKEVSDFTKHITRLKPLAEAAKNAADPAPNATPSATPNAVPSTVPARQVVVRSNLAPGQRFARAALAVIRARGNMHEAIQIATSNKAWQDSPDVAEYLRIKTAIPAGDTATSGWASELVYNTNLVSEFLEYLRPSTILGRIQGWRNVPFNIRVGGASSGLTGYWVGQGEPIPVSKATTTSVSLGITKAAGMAALTKELVRSSSPAAELMVRDELRRALQYLLDRSLIDPTQGGISNEQPAAITYGLTAITATGTTYSALNTDFQTLAANMDNDNIDTSSGHWVMSRTRARALAGMVTSLGVSQFPTMTPEGGTLFGYPVVVSQSAYFSSGSPNYEHLMVFVVPSEVFLADDGMVDVEMSDQAAIQLLDNPTNQSTSGTTATTMVSMYQTESVALKAVRYINWARARTNAVGYIRNAAYA